MSPGSQMRALTASSARAKSSTIAAGSRVERKNCTKSWAMGRQNHHRPAYPPAGQPLA